jgi:cGMP-dependent protein kinase
MATVQELKVLLAERTEELKKRNKFIEHLEKELDKKDATIRHLRNEIDKFRQVLCPLTQQIIQQQGSPRPGRRQDGQAVLRTKRQAISAEPPEGDPGAVGKKISKLPK